MNRKLEELCNKYAGALPRYTSYPTALELRPFESTFDIKQHLLTQLSQQPVALYLHLPHCPSLCYFCACNKIISTQSLDRERYLELLYKEIRLLNEISREKPRIAQLHLGGGSPSYLDLPQLETLLDEVESSFNFSECSEKSIEVDPRTFSSQKARLLAKHGFSRISLGVQDFDASVQSAINRIQSLEMTQQCITEARESGFASINLDLIYGLPEQTRQGFEETISKVVDLSPDRLALYGYAHVNWKHKVQNKFKNYHLPTPEERLDLFLYAQERLNGVGYQYIGLDHFALPQDELVTAQRERRLRRNFMGYTVAKGVGTLALGVSAISDIGGVLYQNHLEIAPYRDSLMQRTLPVARYLERSPSDMLRAQAIEQLMCNAGLIFSALTAQHSELDVKCLRAEVLPKLAPFIEDQLLSLSGDNLEVIGYGQFFLRQLAATFDQYLPKHQERPRFSQAL